MRCWRGVSFPLLALLGLGSPAWAGDGPPTDPAAPSAPEEPPPLTKDPVLVTFVDAPYPAEAQAAGVEGHVVLDIEIDATGKVTNVTIETPAGHGFDEAAVTAAQQFVFSPAEDATGPVPVIIQFDYGFVFKPAEPVVDAAPVEASVNVTGTLREMGSRRLLQHVAVSVIAPEQADDAQKKVAREGAWVTETDEKGAFALRGVPDGTWTLRAVDPGLGSVTQEITLTSGQAVEVKLWMRTVQTDDTLYAYYDKDKNEVTQRTISMETIRRIPGTFGDPIRVVQSLPGAARAPFGTGLLIIRGSNPEDSGVYVDGIRIPYIYHLGGFESVINPGLVSAVDYLPGGFGVQYGRGMGGVVDVTTISKWPERNKITWKTDALDSGAMIQARVGKKKQHAIGLAGRRSYIDVFLDPILKLSGNDGYTIKPIWYDYQAKYELLDHRDTFSVLVFGFEDVLTAQSPAGTAQGTDQDTQGSFGTTYSTHRVMMKWEHPFNDHLSLRFVPAFGRDYASLVVGDSWRLYQTQWLAEIRTELPWKVNDYIRIVPGVDFVGGWSPFEIDLPYNPSNFASTDPLAEREPFVLKDDQTGWGPDPYLFANIRPLKDTDRWIITPGIRGTIAWIPGELETAALDPRVSSKFSITPRMRVKGSVGLYHQPPQPYQMYRTDDELVNLVSEQCLSGAVGWEQDIGKAVHGEIEGFYKGFSNLIVGNPNFVSLDDPFFVNDGVGRAYGLEVIIRHDPIGHFFGWISYTLSRSERRDEPGDDWYSYDYDQTHNLVGVGGYKLPWQMEASARFQYTTGNPTTPYNLGVYDVDQDSYSGYSTAPYNSDRLPPYWTVSARIDKVFTFKVWSLDLFLDLINVVHGTNPEFQIYNYDYTETAYIKSLPFIPSPGFEAKFEF